MTTPTKEQIEAALKAIDTWVNTETAKIFSAYIASLQAEVERRQWQDIGSAPKDGTRVLIFVDGYVKIARSLGVVWSVFHCDDEFYNEEYHLNYPTHWMYPPHPPVAYQNEPEMSGK